MKKIILFFIAVFALQAAEVHWAEDYKDALAKAKQEHKPIYLFISAAECPWCEKFQKHTLTNKKVIKTLNKRFIALHLIRDFDTIPSKFAVRPVPRHYFLTPSGKITHEEIGYADADIFLLVVQNVLKEMKR